MKEFDQRLTHHSHFQYHMKHAIPVQVYERDCHVDVGLITAVDPNFVEIEGTLYNRQTFVFVSRPGY
ncbi:MULTISPECIES: hypothetical protein [Paenibacillus]|uniref:DUF2642 domain-containing protein n=1 Tax=Paenibacillus campinasensis TaxID=66347 RepID=A0A268EGH8_9BACL|nr:MULTISPECIES: hypothetical protein [Paenibacillus]MUG68791.1 hypothetical protein [Paenibacillus campinasensis]PAD72226.1 hypothetical protein CHH67_22855 [Paenibacillus campinasensis]PAK48755.1 hypothetical protein CHH75_22115 [Paenibacillus sp. 7541]